MRRRMLIAMVVLQAGLCGAAMADEILRDPTRPYSAHVGGVSVAPRFAVHAIIVSPERRVAIVNGRRVGVGASVDGATVIAIEKDHLILDQNGQRITAYLNAGGSRQ